MKVEGDRAVIEETGELADAVAEIRRAWLRPNDFEFYVRRLEPEGTEYAIRLRVVVTSIKSGQSIEFAGGHGEAWVPKFALALNRPAFIGG